MDYQDEQNNEIEALDSIYCGEMEILGSTPFHKFIIPIKSEEYEPDTDNGLSCKLKFGYTEKYPEEVPEVEICETENFEDEYEALLKEHIIEQKRFEGTRVTVESFLAWKARFDAEFGGKKIQEKDDRESRKLTGKELFLTDKTLNESDLKFLEDGGDNIKVDESLFQDLEELDLDADETLDDDSS
ncbi:RWD domain-containing protein 1 [Blattella germanica]|nr:RWD domain-containing protein 1 [Blattella germanica]